MKDEFKSDQVRLMRPRLNLLNHLRPTTPYRVSLWYLISDVKMTELLHTLSEFPRPKHLNKNIQFL